MIKVYGASDDLIEVEGSISEEFSASSDEDNYLGFSNGTVLRVRYTDNGTWEIRVMKNGGGKPCITHNNGPDSDSYSDVLQMGDADWVVFGTRLVFGKKAVGA